MYRQDANRRQVVVADAHIASVFVETLAATRRTSDCRHIRRQGFANIRQLGFVITALHTWNNARENIFFAIARAQAGQQDTFDAAAVKQNLFDFGGQASIRHIKFELIVSRQTFNDLKTLFVRRSPFGNRAAEQGGVRVGNKFLFVKLDKHAEPVAHLARTDGAIK